MPGFPAYYEAMSYYPNDRTAQYGFCEWSDLAPHVPKHTDDWHSEHPARAGVYAISVVQGTHTNPQDWDFTASHLLYIGASQNIKLRLSNPKHWLARCLARFNRPNQILVVRVLLTDDYFAVEKSLIQTLRPLLNKQHNG